MGCALIHWVLLELIQGIKLSQHHLFQRPVNTPLALVLQIPILNLRLATRHEAMKQHKYKSWPISKCYVHFFKLKMTHEKEIAYAESL